MNRRLSSRANVSTLLPATLALASLLAASSAARGDTPEGRGRPSDHTEGRTDDRSGRAGEHAERPGNAELVERGGAAEATPEAEPEEDGDIAEARARSRGDGPELQELCRAAVAMALAEPERARSFVSRARLAGWLPELRFRAYRRFARTEGVTFDDTGAGTVTPVDINAVDDVRYEWRATWDLSRMVFNPDELQAHSEALRMADVRRDIQSLVIRLYFERHRLLAGRAVASPAATSSRTDASSMATVRSTETSRRLRVLEIEAELDALSGGAFTDGVHGRRAASAP